MLRFLTFRILGAIPLLFLLSIVTFAIIQAPPGDYADYIRSMLINQGGVRPDLAEIQAEAYRQANGLNDPLIIQYFRWITGIVTRFDFGHSLYYNKPVGNVIAERLPPTILLALVCHILASLLGIGLGIIAATRQYSWVDTLLGIISFLGMTIPRFLFAIIIMYVLVFRIGVNEIGSFNSAYWGGQPWLGAVRRSGGPCVASRLHRHLRWARL